MPPCVSWDAPRIHAELLELGFPISERTVSRFVPEKPVDPDAVKQWTRWSLGPALVVFTIDMSGATLHASLPDKTSDFDPPRLLLGPGPASDRSSGTCNSPADSSPATELRHHLNLL